MPRKKDSMNLVFNYNLSQKGQLASLKAGGDGKSSQRVEGQITPEQFENDLLPLNWTLNAVGNLQDPEKRSWVYDLSDSSELIGTVDEYIAAASYNFQYDPKFKPVVFDEPQSFEALYDCYLKTYPIRKEIAKQVRVGRAKADIAKKAQAETNLQAKITEFYNNSSMRCGDLWGGSFFGHSISSNHPDYADLKAEVDRRNKLDRDVAEAESQARADAKARQIAEWVASNGTDNQKARFAAGLFPESEATQAIEDHAFEPLAERERYQPIKNKEVREACDDDCTCRAGYDNCSISIKADDATSVSAEEWDLLQEFQSALPDASFVLRRVYAECSDDDCKNGFIKRNQIYAKIVVGGFTFNRKYAA